MTKIGLVGGNRTTQFQAPYFSDEWQIWATAPKNMEWVPRFHLWFEIHHPDDAAIFPKYMDWLCTLPGVYVHPKQKKQPGFIPYPVDRIVGRFGRSPFTSSAAWMFALALIDCPEAIGLWGFEMSGTDEYGYQRRGLHQLVDIAKDMGVEVVVPDGTTLLDPLPLYGQDRVTQIDQMGANCKPAVNPWVARDVRIDAQLLGLEGSGGMV